MTHLYRVLLHLFPSEFRTRYGDELIALFVAERLEPRHAGALGLLRFWRHILYDLVTTATRQRTRQIRLMFGSGVPRLPAQPKRTEMDTLLQDLRYAFRSFVRRPGFTAIAVLSLALGIGANSLIYGLVDGFVLRPFPYPDPDRLVSIGVSFPKISPEMSHVEVLSPVDTPTFAAPARWAALALSISAIATFPAATCPNAYSQRSCWTTCSRSSG